eukprot:COSAG05_NODE_27_length_29281_cov_199.946919_9_plen_116_part_00
MICLGYEQNVFVFTPDLVRFSQDPAGKKGQAWDLSKPEACAEMLVQQIPHVLAAHVAHRTARPPTPPSGVESLPLPSTINQPTLFIFSSTYLWKFQPLVPKLARFASLCYVTAVI